MMKEKKKKEDRQKSVFVPSRRDMTETWVVDIFNPPSDSNHWILVLHRLNDPGDGKRLVWFIACIHTQVPVNIWDKIYVDEGEFQLYLDRGPIPTSEGIEMAGGILDSPLLYRLDTGCRVPLHILDRLTADLDRLAQDLGYEDGIGPYEMRSF